MALGNGVVLVLADYKYKTKQNKIDMVKIKLFEEFDKTNENAESGVNEALSQEQKMVETFLKRVAKEFDYSIQDAARFVKDTISKMGLHESANDENAINKA